MMRKNRGPNVFDLFTLGFGSIIGVGWSVTLNNIIGAGGGPISASTGFILAAVVMLPIALCYAELTPMMPVAGGSVAYAYQAFGSKISYITGWLLALVYVSILPWEAIAVNEIVSFIFPSLKTGPLLYTVAGTNIYLNSLLVGLGLSLLIITINWLGAKVAMRFQALLTILLIIAIALCVAFALGKADPTNMKPVYAAISGKSHTSFITGLISIFSIAPFYFIGFDTIPQGVEDAEIQVKPKAMGLVIVGAVLFAGMTYVLIIISAGLAYPWQQILGTDRPVLANVLRLVYKGGLGEALFWMNLLGTLAGLLTTWNGFYIAGSRLFLGMGRAKLLPEIFAKRHPRTQTPIGGSLLCAIIMCCGPFMGIGLIDALTILASSGCVVTWMITCASAFRLRNKLPDINRPFRMPYGKVIAVIGLVCYGLMFLNCIVPSLPGYMGSTGIKMLIGWIILGALLYAVSSKNRCSISEGERSQRIMSPDIEKD